MEIETILALLNNSGFHNLGADSANIYMEDPGCVVRSFQIFLEYAWSVLLFITGILLAGWAWAMIRGSKNAESVSVMNNVKNLILILGTICAVPVFVNTIYGGDLIGQGCKTVAIPLEKVNALLDMRNDKMKKYDEFQLYEELNIYDSGVNMAQMPYSVASLSASGTPGVINPNTDNNTSGQLQPSTNTTINTTPVLRTESTQNMTPVRAIASGKDVIYVATDNTQYKHVGGTRAWRNNNPGNIRMSEFSRRAGAIGEAGGFAVFPDEQTGARAVKQLLTGNSYKNLTIANAVSRYAPPSENNTVAYQRSIERLTGLSVNRRISELNDAELDKVVNAIRQIEGWKPGQIEKI